MSARRPPALLVLGCVVALAVAACEAFEPPPSGGEPGGGGGHGGSGSGTPAPGLESTAPVETSTPVPTVTPAPLAVTFADLKGTAAGTRVRLVGRIRLGSFTSCGLTCQLYLADPAKPADEIVVEVAVGEKDPPEPNTMASLPSSYATTDLLVTTDDGSTVRSGDIVALTGELDFSSVGNPYLPSVERVEPATATLPKPVAVTFTTITKQKEGTFVRITGKLAVPFLVSCYGGTCGLYLEDPKASSRTVMIEVVLGTKDVRTPNTMWPLPDNFKDSNLRVIAADGTILRAGALVKVTGWIDRYGDGNKKFSIDPVHEIVKSGS